MAVIDTSLDQTPRPDTGLIQRRGDRVSFRLQRPRAAAGSGWLRTNLGNARRLRNEIIRHVEEQAPILFEDWSDVPMRRVDERTFEVTLPLSEIGYFQAKTFFLPDGSDEPVWPAGGNVAVKVEPADACCSSTIYTAFVRQFGPDKAGRRDSGGLDPAIRALESSGYAVIPRSGTFRDLARELDHIIGRLRFRIVQLLPIHPIPTTYARMGRFGSPFAVLDFMDVEPSLAEFDRHTTPLDQFRELADAVHERRARLFIDIPINHTGWASSLQIHQPQWFARNEDRSFQSPGAWGVTWHDLSKLDYGRDRSLWTYMADVFLHWCRQGVDGFRCDAGYMIPEPVWTYIVAKVRREYPDTIFMLEGLGGRLETVERLLSGANLDWAYSELFQNYSQAQIESYLPECIRTSSARGTLVHFAETHDNDRLAARSPAYARMRTALAALCANHGAFGITNGVEWYAREKVDVHEATPLNWGSEANQVMWIARLNAILEAHACFHADAERQLIHEGPHEAIALRRRSADRGQAVLILANLDDRRPTEVVWKASEYPGAPLHDLLRGEPVDVRPRDDRRCCSLAPGEVLCLTDRVADIEAVASLAAREVAEPDACTAQRVRAKVLEILGACRGLTDVADIDVEAEGRRLTADPRRYCAQAAGRGYPPVTTYEWPVDARRTVMVPPGHFLLVRAGHPFIAEWQGAPAVARGEHSLPAADGSHFALLTPRETPAEPVHECLAVSVFEPGHRHRTASPLLALGPADRATVRVSVTGEEIRERDLYAIGTNGANGFAQVRAAWGEVRSQYDALLAADLSRTHPNHRRVMLTRCRGWLVHRGYSQEINLACTERFSVAEAGRLAWRFLVPCGLGKRVPLVVAFRLLPGRNTAVLEFLRPAATDGCLSGEDPVQLILRPDIEDRSAHEKTKAFLGPEHAWRAAVVPSAHGFTFTPHPEHVLRMTAAPGTFVHEPEWTYMVPHPFEAERGLGGHSDLFSPGYFSCWLREGEKALITADADSVPLAPVTAGGFTAPAPADAGPWPLKTAQAKAMPDFLVRRGTSAALIAGYPWFLDWGRDTLIGLRGLIAAGRRDEARTILRQFARHEDRGTLPNMIQGEDTSNRDTSDAPLWLFVACADLAAAEGRDDLLSLDCGGRSLLDVLLSIAEAYIEGTPNGIRMDPGSGLVFSPGHFTWMDTNHPAGTPREGYPIEIQALWHAAVSFLAHPSGGRDWRQLADQVKASIARHFAPGNQGYLSDCLHAGPAATAEQAVPDDALRPNQLLAITLGAVTDRALGERVLSACETLLVPGAIRSLADRPVRRPLPVYRGTALLNDPSHPYWGRYQGDEDTRRKPAYHNGTAWTWLFPSYAEALFRVYGPPVRDAALALLAGAAEPVNEGCLLHVPEVLDGDTPHQQRGCGAQAWGCTELYRVLDLLTRRP